MEPPEVVATFPPVHRRLWVGAVMAFGFIIVHIAALCRRTTPGLTWMDAAFGLAPFAALLIAVGFVARIRRNRPAVVVRRDGFEERAGMFTMGFVPWSEVNGLVIYGTQRHQYLCVYVRDPYALLASRPLVTRLGKRVSMLLGWPPVTIPQAMVKTRLALIREPMIAAANAARTDGSKVEVVDRILGGG